MRIPSRVAYRLALSCGLAAAAAWGPGAAPARAAAPPPEKLLPAGSTLALVKLRDANEFRTALGRSQAGQLFDDPAVKPLRDDLAAKLDQGGQKLKERIGVTIPELLQLPQGPAWVAVLTKDDPKVPVALLVSADAGKNEQAMADVLAKATKQAEESGGKLSVETFHDLTLTVIRSPKDEDKEAPPLAWARNGSLFHIGTDVDALKDLLAHSDGREDSLADSESFKLVERKLGEGTQATYYLDIARAIQMGTRLAAAAQGGQAGQFDAIVQLLGLDKLKALGGSLAFNAGDFDQVSRTVLVAPGEPTGLLKAFKLPPADLKPEPWVSASVASYETVSWDLDNAYEAINDLANTFNPGLLDNLQKTLVPPGGGESLNFKKDLIAPLGNRLTMVGDFKKPINEDSQRILFSVALRDPKAFQTTLNRIFALAKAKPKSREFQGTTILDVEFDRPAAPGANAPAGKGKVSLAVAKGNVFVASEPSLVEQVIRTGGPALADSPAYQAVAKHFPEQVSLLAFQRSEEQARLLYDLFKSGKFQKAIQGANMVGGPGADKAVEFIDPDKLPDFSVIAKYLSPAGSYGTPDEDGFTVTRFTLRKSTP